MWVMVEWVSRAHLTQSHWTSAPPRLYLPWTVNLTWQSATERKTQKKEKKEKKRKCQAPCNMTQVESIPANVAKWKERKKTEIPLSHELERNQMDSADVLRSALPIRQQVRGAAVPRLLYNAVPWYQIMNFMRALSNKSIANLWIKKRDCLWFESRRAWKNMHIGSIFLQSLRKHDVASFRAIMLIYPPPFPPSDAAARDRSGWVCEGLWRKITKTDSGEKREMPGGQDLLTPSSETRDHTLT